MLDLVAKLIDAIEEHEDVKEKWDWEAARFTAVCEKLMKERLDVADVIK